MSARGTRLVQLGEATYRDGARERLSDALALLRAGRFAGSVYLAGRGVEGMMRALLWRPDPGIRLGRKDLETGHDLRRLLTQIRNLGLLRNGETGFEARVQHIGRVWFNNARFASSNFLAIRWRAVGEVRAKRSLKRASEDFYEDCSAIIKRCELLWEKRRFATPSRPG